jgi:hypothetical protein
MVYVYHAVCRHCVVIAPEPLVLHNRHIEDVTASCCSTRLCVLADMFDKHDNYLLLDKQLLCAYELHN